LICRQGPVSTILRERRRGITSFRYLRSLFFCDTLSYKENPVSKTKGVCQWWVRINILATEEAEWRTIIVGGKSRQTVQKTPSWKFPTESRAAGVAQEVEYLPRKHESMRSNPENTK
jgi:hypothetical protein